MTLNLSDNFHPGNKIKLEIPVAGHGGNTFFRLSTAFFTCAEFSAEKA